MKDVPGTFNKALGKYLKSKGSGQIQGIALPGLNKATAMIKAAQKRLAIANKGGGKNDLTVRGGLDSKGIYCCL